MIKGGYILQPRLFDGSDASRLPPCAREVWLYVLRNVNHTDDGKFKRGSGFVCIREIQEALCWYVGYRKMGYSKTQIAKALRRLCEDSMTTTTKTTRGLIVTVCNYDYYQDPKNYEDHSEGSAKAQRRPRQGNTINKNDKNGKNDKKKKYGDFKNVLLTSSEHKKLKDKFNSSLDKKIYNLSEYMARTGKSYKSHYLTILNWAKKDKPESKSEFE